MQIGVVARRAGQRAGRRRVAGAAVDADDGRADDLQVADRAVDVAEQAGKAVRRVVDALVEGGTPFVVFGRQARHIAAAHIIKVVIAAAELLADIRFAGVDVEIADAVAVAENFRVDGVDVIRHDGQAGVDVKVCFAEKHRAGDGDEIGQAAGRHLSAVAGLIRVGAAAGVFIIVILCGVVPVNVAGNRHAGDQLGHFGVDRVQVLQLAAVGHADLIADGAVGVDGDELIEQAVDVVYGHVAEAQRRAAVVRRGEFETGGKAQVVAGQDAEAGFFADAACGARSAVRAVLRKARKAALVGQAVEHEGRLDGIARHQRFGELIRRDREFARARDLLAEQIAVAVLELARDADRDIQVGQERGRAAEVLRRDRHQDGQDRLLAADVHGDGRAGRVDKRAGAGQAGAVVIAQHDLPPRALVAHDALVVEPVAALAVKDGVYVAGGGIVLDQNLLAVQRRVDRALGQHEAESGRASRRVAVFAGPVVRGEGGVAGAGHRVGARRQRAAGVRLQRVQPARSAQLRQVALRREEYLPRVVVHLLKLQRLLHGNQRRDGDGQHHGDDADGAQHLHQGEAAVPAVSLCALFHKGRFLSLCPCAAGNLCTNPPLHRGCERKNVKNILNLTLS